MGAWGTAISSNDTYADVYATFFDLYNEGFDVEYVSEKLILNNQDIINDVADQNNFWFALAKAQWECKQLDNAVLEKVTNIIASDSDIELCRSLGASNTDLKKRKAALDKFFITLTTEKPKPKARKKKIIYQPTFQKGDCLTFKLENGNFGGAIVLEVIKNTEYGLNLIAATRINQPQKPSKKDFESTDVLIKNYGNWNDKPGISWYNPTRHKPITHLTEATPKISVEIDYDVNKAIYPHIADFDIHIIDAVNQQLKHEKSNLKPPTKLKVKDLIKKKWKFW